MPLVVKFADTPKEKDQKKLQQQTQNLWSAAASNNTLAALGPSYLAVSNQLYFQLINKHCIAFLMNECGFCDLYFYLCSCLRANTKSIVAI